MQPADGKEARSGGAAGSWDPRRAREGTRAERAAPPAIASVKTKIVSYAARGWSPRGGRFGPFLLPSFAGPLPHFERIATSLFQGGADEHGHSPPRVKRHIHE